MLFRPTVLFAGLMMAYAAGAAPVEELVKPCLACHGANGVASAPQTPHLNGQLADYLQQEISGLSNGERKSDVPDHVAKGLPGKDVQAIAKYFADIKAVRPKQETDAQKVAAGAQVYRERCMDCHTDSGRGSDKDAPLMAGQDLAYMAAQTKLFLNGKRRFPFKMDDAYKGLTEQQLEAISHFFASQEQVVAQAQPAEKPAKRRR